MRRVSYAQWQRNLAIALGNGPATTEAIGALQNAGGKLTLWWMNTLTGRLKN